jgi:hypothetical protein
MCEADFSVEGYNIDEEISYCPYCGSVIDPDLDGDFDEEFYDEDRLED